MLSLKLRYYPGLCVTVSPSLAIPSLRDDFLDEFTSNTGIQSLCNKDPPKPRTTAEVLAAARRVERGESKAADEPWKFVSAWIQVLGEWGFDLVNDSVAGPEHEVTNTVRPTLYFFCPFLSSFFRLYLSFCLDYIYILFYPF